MPVQTSVITGTVAHKHSATGGSSDGGKLAVGGLGGDTSFDLTNGSIMYSNGTSLEELSIGNASDTLTVSGGVPAWAAAGGGASLEFIDSQTSTGNDFSTFTFSDAVDYDDYCEMRAVFNLGTTSSRDICLQVGDTAQGGVMTGSYQQQKCDNNAGTWTTETHSGEAQWCPASHPRIDSADGVTGWVRIFLAYFNDGSTRLMEQAFIQGQDSFFIAGGYNTTSQDDLKYFRIYIGSNDLVSGSNVTCYKLRKS